MLLSEQWAHLLASVTGGKRDISWCADREGFRRKKIAEEIDHAIGETGLNLEGERRALFARRYGEERRKVEEQLRKELEEKRQPLLKDIIARLKAEFSAEPAAPR